MSWGKWMIYRSFTHECSYFFCEIMSDTNCCFSVTQSSGIYICFMCTWLSIFVWDKMLLCLFWRLKWGVYTHISQQILDMGFCILYRIGDKMWQKLCSGWPVANVEVNLQNGRSSSFGLLKIHCFFAPFFFFFSFHCLRLDISPVTWGTWEW